MKKLERLSMAVALTIMLAGSALAGDIDIPAPPPPPSASATTPGDIETPRETQNPNVLSDSATEAALNLLQSMLSVF